MANQLRCRRLAARGEAEGLVERSGDQYGTHGVRIGQTCRSRGMQLWMASVKRFDGPYGWNEQ